MNDARWLLYGAYGFTGRWIVEEAVARGLEPILAGRDGEKLRAVAREFDRPYRTVSLSDPDGLREALRDVEAVMHAAGPYARTGRPMIEACLDTATHYVDITGEITVFRELFSRDERARREGVALLGGMGFDVVPTDCLANYVADSLPEVDALELVVNADLDPTAGTVKSSLGMIPEGGKVWRDGELLDEPVAARSRTVDFPGGPRRAVSAPLGDVLTAARSTGARAVTTYLVLPDGGARLMRLATPVLGRLLRFGPLRRAAEAVVEKTFSGPSREDRAASENWIYARARSRGGDEAEAWLRTPETYWFTALSCVEAMRTLAGNDLVGALTPCMAFGADFVLNLEGVERCDALPDRTA